MDERSFWVGLMFRISGEFAELPDRRYQYFWCDGFDPSQYLLDDQQPRIIGKAWICNGRAQDYWDFALLLPMPLASTAQIVWASFIPPSGVTRWMALDEHRQHIEFEPGKGIRDRRTCLKSIRL
jgi:hypothetical protein